MKAFLAAGVLSVSLAGQAVAHETDVTRLTQPTSDDIANAKAVTDAFIAILESGDTERAIRQVAEGNRLISEKPQQVNLLFSQAKNAELLYGAIKKCVPSEYSYDSSLRIEFKYVCQHEESLLEWQLKLDNLPSGWTISNFSFSDTF
ncbi:MAG: hypothetical protein O3C52_09715 [Proteobacteria bacterium]|nr:hypothetical protein [Pseudomonadota bacterium]